MLYRVYLLLGSNMGNREQLISSACTKVADALMPLLPNLNAELPSGVELGSAMPLVVPSAVIETEPWGFEAETKFLNMAMSVKTFLNPVEILDACQRVEEELGRDRKAEGPQFDAEGRRIYHSRPIDIDLLYCEAALGENGGKILWKEIKMNEPRLTLPHRALPEREFAQELLKDVIVRENK